jgi:menaquinol-cytochrome c reductase iron-sulfur subunit
MPSRRDFYRIGSALLASGMACGLAIPGVAYVLDPLRRKSGGGTTQELAKLSVLKVGVPQAFTVIDERRDAWTKYPREPVGTVWLVRQPAGTEPPVVAYTAACPHLGCLIALAAGGKSFICHCHHAQFKLDGVPLNSIPPRGMDTLNVTLTEGDDPGVVVEFQKFRPQGKEKTPRV